MTKIEERLITALDECLSAIKAGETVESCLAHRPDEIKELAPLLQIALALQSLPHPGPSPATKQTSKHQFLAEAERRRAFAKRNLWKWFSQRFSILTWAGPVRALAAVGIALALILVIGGSVIYAASDSLPGDSLYGIKRLSEDVQHALTFSHSSRIRLEDTFTERRRVEVHHLLSKGQHEEVIFGGVLRERSGGVWWVEDIPVTVNADTLVQRVEPPTNIFVEIHGATQADGTVLAHLVEIEGDKVIGLVEVIGQDDWQIAGQHIQVDDGTHIEGQLQVGDCVEVHARRFPDGTLLALEIEQTEECHEDDSNKDQDDDIDEETATPTMQPSPGPTSPPPDVSPTPTDEGEDKDEEEMEEEEEATPTMQPPPTPASPPPNASPTPTDDDDANDDRDNDDDSDQDDDDTNRDKDNGDDSDQDDDDDANRDKDNSDDSDQDDDDANDDRDNGNDSDQDDSDDSNGDKHNDSNNHAKSRLDKFGTLG